MISIVACCRGAKLCAQAARDFRSQHKQSHAASPSYVSVRFDNSG